MKLKIIFVIWFKSTAIYFVNISYILKIDFIFSEAVYVLNWLYQRRIYYLFDAITLIADEDDMK